MATLRRLSVILLSVASSLPAQTRTVAERLGYPRDAKLLILHADDLGFTHKGGSLFMTYLQNKEQLARRSAGGTLGALGITGV